LKWLYLLVALAVVAALALSAPANGQASGQECPPGSLVVNATGAFICAFEVEEVTPVYASLHLVQEGNNFTVYFACLDVAGCNVNLKAYSYENGSLSYAGGVAQRVEKGGLAAWSFIVGGRGVVEVWVNEAFLGHYAAPAAGAPTAVSEALSELAGSSPLLTVVAGLVVVGVPLGWILQREFGTAGLALAGASMLVYLLTRSLTGSDVVSIVVAAVCGLVGVVLVVMHGGGA